MSGEVCYLDASALTKLVLEERESIALASWLRPWAEQVSSAVVDVELHRAVLRDPIGIDGLHRARTLLQELTLVELTPMVIGLARQVEPPRLRALDAIHLASALSLGEDLGVLVAYDQRLLDAADAAGLAVASPA